jgi:hypothetical protein
MDMHAAFAWLGSWFRQCLLQRAPQDDPLSYRGLLGALASYTLVDLIQARTTSDWGQSLALSFMDTLLMTVFCALVLLIVQKQARFVQTLTALAGTSAVLGLLAMPLMLQASRLPEDQAPSAALLMGGLTLLIWTVAVQAHIFRHALSSWYGVGLLVAGLHSALAIALVNYLLFGTTH